jgi:hypothetical protein
MKKNHDLATIFAKKMPVSRTASKGVCWTLENLPPSNEKSSKDNQRLSAIGHRDYMKANI